MHDLLPLTSGTTCLTPLALVVAEAMNGYMLMDKTLQCHVMLKAKVHERIFDGAGRKFKRINWRQISRNQTNAEQNEAQKQRSMKRRRQGRAKLSSKLKDLGIDYSYTTQTLPRSEATVQERSQSAKKRKRSFDGEDEVQGARDSARQNSGKKMTKKKGATAKGKKKRSTGTKTQKLSHVKEKAKKKEEKTKKKKAEKK